MTALKVLRLAVSPCQVDLQGAAWAGVPRLSLAYEDLAADPGQVLGRVARFLAPEDPPALRPSDRTAAQSGARNAEWRACVIAALGGRQPWLGRPHDWSLERSPPPRWRQKLPLGRAAAF